MKATILISVIAASFLLVGCDSDPKGRVEEYTIRRMNDGMWVHVRNDISTSFLSSHNYHVVCFDRASGISSEITLRKYVPITVSEKIGPDDKLATLRVTNKVMAGMVVKQPDRLSVEILPLERSRQ